MESKKTYSTYGTKMLKVCYNGNIPEKYGIVVVIWGYSQGEHKLMSNKDKRKDIPSGPGDADGGEAGFEEEDQHSHGQDHSGS